MHPLDAASGQSRRTTRFRTGACMIRVCRTDGKQPQNITEDVVMNLNAFKQVLSEVPAVDVMKSLQNFLR